MPETYRCDPTLNDSQVLDFCIHGFLKLDGVVPADVNARAMAYADEHPTLRPDGLLSEPWFVDGVILNPAAVGAVRSILGNDLVLPYKMTNHRNQNPSEGQKWHIDGGAIYGPAVHFLQVFYYPQATVPEDGPTEVLPGSHFLSSDQRLMAHYGNIRGAVLTTAPAGSIFLTNYSIWHRKSPGTSTGLRNLFKYNYWRTREPTRDWIHEPGFDPATADYGIEATKWWFAFRQQFRDHRDAAEMFFWLSGRHAEYQFMGGQGWPAPTPGRGMKRLGYPGDIVDKRSLQPAE